MKQRGFTLLEMVIGMTLLGFILVLLYAGLRLGTRGWDAGEKSVESTARQVAVGEFLRRQLSQVYPLRWKTSDLREVVAFAGESDALYFAAPIAARLTAGGVHLLALDKEKIDGEPALRLRWHMTSPELKSFEFPSEKSQVGLVKGVEEVRFAYYGADTRDVEPAWSDSWHSDTQIPLLIRMRIKAADGTQWPEILVAPKLTGDATCNWDPDFKRCK